MKKLIAICGCLLAGCAGGGIVDMGNGRYTVTDSSVRGVGPARAEIVQQAKETCDKWGKVPVFEPFDDKGMDASLRSSSSVIFHCE